MPTPFVSEIELDEGERWTSHFPFTDSDGDAAPSGTFVWSSITATYKNEFTGEVVNSRDSQNVDGVNGGLWDDDEGRFVFTFSPEDTEVSDSVPPGLYQRNILVVEFVGTENGAAVHTFLHVRALVRSRRLVPQS